MSAIVFDDAAKLEAIFGGWPSFHDAEVLRVVLDRAGPEGPSIEMAIHVCEPTGEVSPAGVWVYHHHTEVTLRFDRITDLRLEDFNRQNVIARLEVSTIGDAAPAGLRVSMTSSHGMEAMFECRRATVADVRPFTPR
jgi:hypothetical protein